MCMSIALGMTTLRSQRFKRFWKKLWTKNSSQFVKITRLSVSSSLKILHCTPLTKTILRLSTEISSMLTKYLKMIQDKQYDAIRAEVSSMPPCPTRWLNPNFKLEYTMGSDSDSSCSDDEDEAMDISTDNTAVQRTNVPVTDADGWTTVPSKRR